MASDEAALIELIATGNQDALSQLYALFRPRLWRYLYHLLDGNPDWVEEVMQDVFLAIWMHAHSFRGDSAISTWIFRIGRNKALLAQRSHVRHPEGHLATNPSELDESYRFGEVTSLEDSVMNRLALADAFHHLSTIHQEVLELFAYQGFSLDEIAQILVIPKGTVKSRLNHARHALFKQLTQHQLEGEIAK